MSDDITSEVSAAEPGDGAPSERARALREEILGGTLTVDEAAYVLSLDRTTIAKYLRDGTLFGFQIGREWRVTEDELREYVRRMKEQCRAEPGGTEVVSAPRPSANLLDRLARELRPGGRRRGRLRNFDRFSGRAREVLSLAGDEATRLGHDHIGTEHLLLGLLAEGEGIAGQALTRLGVALPAARAEVERVLGRGPGRSGPQIGLAPRAKQAIEAAVAETNRLGHYFVGTEHLLLGLLDQDKSLAGQILAKLGASPEAVRAEVNRLLAAPNVVTGK